MVDIILKLTQVCQDSRLLTLTSSINNLPIHHLLAFLLITVVLTVKYLRTRHPRTVYLVEYACFGPNSKYRIAPAFLIENLRLSNFLDNDDTSFLSNISRRSGLGDETCFPSSIHYIPSIPSFNLARMEAEQVIFMVIDNLFAKAPIEHSKIDILIVNCSLMTMIPSMTDMIINRYKLRKDIQNVQLSGMGCSAGLIAVGLATNLLQTMPCGAHALVVSTEIMTCNFYAGKNRSMLLANMLFRMGGAAVLLSNSRDNARFQLLHTVRKSTAAQDSAYHCVFHEEDDEGNLGVNLSKDLVVVAGEALKANISTSAPLLLSVSEKLTFLLSSMAQKVFLKKNTRRSVPNFGLVVEHFCIHAGGRAVIDAVQRSLNLSDEQVEPSRMALHRFGNTSSSSNWYEMAYCEAKQSMRKGDRVWMIGFGAGYDCNSAVWKCIRPSHSVDSAWAHCIHRYPMELKKINQTNNHHE